MDGNGREKTETGLDFRRFEASDTSAVVALDEWALAETDAVRTDIPGHEDVTAIERAYFDAGGEFLVGVVERGTDPARTLPANRRGELQTTDGTVVAMGGFLPSEAGYDDERTVPGAAELHRMRVAPTCQRAGTGSALLAALEQRIARTGFDTILATTSERQPAAISFYPAHGYEQVGTSQYGEYSLVHFEKTVG